MDARPRSNVSLNDRGKLVISRHSALLLAVLLAVSLSGCANTPEPVRKRPTLNMAGLSDLADSLGLTVSYPGSTGMVMLSGDRGTVVFNPRMKGILIGDAIHFRGHRTVVRGDRVSVPAGFLARCETVLLPREPEPDPVEPEPEPDPGVRGHVVIDPGHGGRDPGTIGANGGHEKVVNLAVSKLIATNLRAAGVKVTMTRTGDSYVELNDRAAVGNRLGADLFVSIHSDWVENRTITGFSAWVCHTKYSESSRAALIFAECNQNLAGLKTTLALNRARSNRLASLVRSEMGKATRGTDRGTRLGALRVLRRSASPAALIELGFMSNPGECARLYQASHRRTLADAISKAVVRFLKQNG
jgi:N-acetylmuramoyl-L-alanine amidase